MKHCLSIDVAKGKSMIGLMNEDGEILIKYREIEHNKFDLLEIHNEVQNLNLDDLAVIMESTGASYHLVDLKFFKDLNYKTILLNPIISKEHKRNLRKTKTDMSDCLNLANIYFKEAYNKQIEIPDVYVELQHISRQIYSLNESIVRYKN